MKQKLATCETLQHIEQLRIHHSGKSSRLFVSAQRVSLGFLAEAGSSLDALYASLECDIQPLEAKSDELELIKQCEA